MANLIETTQFEEDLNWCIEKICTHFTARPYWEESTIAHFTRDSNTDERYWKKINQIATKRITEIPSTLLHSEAYRELNHMAFFAINIITSALIDENIKPQELEEILILTTTELSKRAPSTLSKHDESLKNMQRCIDIFCEEMDMPPTDFVCFSKKMNEIRITEINNSNQPKYLFSISSTDTILQDNYNNDVMSNLYSHLTNISKISMTSYRASRAITELIIHYNNGKTFMLTILEGELRTPPLSSDDIRLAHKEISLPDATDIVIFVTRFAHYANLSPSLQSDPDSAEVLIFN